MALPETPEDGKFRILLAEDDPMIAKLVSVTLAKAGLLVNHSADGAAAWAMFQRIDPHLVITDIMMPGMDGHQLTAKIRDASSVPVIMMTAADSEDNQMQGFKVGADDYVPKPFNPKLLMARVVANLRRVYRYSVAETEAKVEKTKAEMRAGGLNSFVDPKVPEGWLQCDSCGYMGPHERFESENAQGNKRNVCPVCREASITFSIN